jgi:hypothetical protein
MITVQPGTSQLAAAAAGSTAADVVGLTIVDYQISSFNDFRYFNASNFAAPLTPDAIKNINFNSVTWDGEKFIAVGDRSTVILGTPDQEDEVFIDLANQNPLVTGINSDQVGTTVLNNAFALAMNIVAISTSAPTDPAITIDGNRWFETDTGLLYEWQNGAWVVIGPTVTQAALPIGTAIVFTGPVINGTQVSQTLYTSRYTDIASSRIYVKGFSGIEFSPLSADGKTPLFGKHGIPSANWKVSLALPEFQYQVDPNTLDYNTFTVGTQIEKVGKFAKFTWKYARGSGRSYNLTYNSVAVNRTTMQLANPLTMSYDSASGLTLETQQGKLVGIPSNTELTYYDPSGNKFVTKTTQIIKTGTTTLALPTNVGINAGYTFLPTIAIADLITNFNADLVEANRKGFTELAAEIVNSIYILNQLVYYGFTYLDIFAVATNPVTTTPYYEIGGQLDHLSKDIPDLIPGTSYPGVQVTGQAFNDPSVALTKEYYSGGTITGVTGTTMLNLDTIVTSDYADKELGTRPDDILIYGGQFIDNYSSHSPEELVPGQMSDSLQMTVFTAKPFTGNNLPDYSNVLAYKIFTDDVNPTVYYRITGANTAVTIAALEYTDHVIHISDITRLPDPDPITNKPGSVWLNGERINYFSRVVPALFTANATFVANSVISSSLVIEMGNVFGSNLNLGLSNIAIVGSQLITANIGKESGYTVTGVFYANNSILVTVPANTRGTVIARREPIDFYPPLLNPRPGQLADLRRGAKRTSIPLEHPAGSIITDASPEQEIARDTILAIASDLTVNNLLVSRVNEFGNTQANTSVYQSAITSLVPQGKLWLDLGTS